MFSSNTASVLQGTGSTRIMVIFITLSFILPGLITGVNGFFAADAEIPVTETAIPDVSILNPAGGELLRGGETLDIQWENLTREPGPVDIFYSIDNGLQWTMIGEQEMNDGSFEWKLPYVDSNECLIKMSAGSQAFAVSNSTFTIDSTVPSIDIISPRGGDVWESDSIQTISWKVNENHLLASQDTVIIEYSTNGGLDWNNIILNAPNTGTYLWTVPAENSETCQIKIEVTDAAGNVNYGRSEGYFEIFGAVSPDSLNSAPVDDINAEPLLMWNKTLNPWVRGEPAVYDLDNDGDMEIVVGDTANKVVCLDHLGNEIWNVSVIGDKYVSPPAIDDLDNDGIPEILVSVQYYPNPPNEGRVYCIDPNGSINWVYFRQNQPPTAGPAIFDINKDGIKEVIVNLMGAGTVCLDHNGNELWLTLFPNYKTDVNPRGVTPAIEDIDGDGNYEVISPVDHTGIAVLDKDGNLLWCDRWNGPGTTTGLTVADLNYDGNFEILKSGSNYSEGSGFLNILGGNKIYCYDIDGNILWSKNVSYDGAFSSGVGSPITADIDGDNDYEIITVFENWVVRVFDSDGNEIWNFSDPSGEVMSNWLAPASVADIYPTIPGLEILINAPQNLYVVSSNGTLIWNCTLPGGFGVRSKQPIIADIDNDSNLEVLVGGWNLYCFKFYSGDSSDKAPWPTFNHDNRRTGRYNDVYTVLNTNTNEYFSSIQAAIDDTDTLNGHTISVSAGTYYENLIIDKEITLAGENRDTTIIDGGGAGSTMTVTSNWVNVSGFTFMNSGNSSEDSGIELNNVQNCIIGNNNIYSNVYAGFHILSSNNNSITNNNVSSNTYDGFHIQSSNNNTFADNIVSLNKKNGFWSVWSNGNTIVNNTVTSNNWIGVSFASSIGNSIVDNTISNNEFGIVLNHANYTTITNNLVTSNNDTGIYIYASSDSNIIYHNNLINNTNQAYDEGTNFWDNDYPSGGNYWNDYGGVDGNGDGIGDTPYTFTGGQDNYPLMTPFGTEPGPIDHIIVTPDPATVVVGMQQQFTATAYDEFNVPIPNATFLWNTDLGVINFAGLFTAQTTPGTGFVSATFDGVTGTASVEVVPDVVNHIIVSPNPVSIVVGNTEQFSATAYDIYNNVIDGVEFDWSTDVGTINTTGFFTARTVPGSGSVTATNGTVSGAASLEILIDELDSIVVSPTPVWLPVGDTCQFTATAYDQYGNEIPGVDMIWTVTKGSIDSSGLFTAPTLPGISVVTAANSTISGTALAIVQVGPIHHIIVLPDPVNITVGGSQQFTATAFDEYDNVINGVDFTWSTNVGSVDGTGLFMAQTMPGTGYVRASNNSIIGSASVTVEIGSIDHVEVTPDPAIMHVGEQQQFTATAYDMFNNSIPGIDFDWSTDVGVIDQNGLLTAQTTPVSGTVTAVNGTFSDTAAVTVEVGNVDHIILVPDSVVISVGGTQQFTASAYDSYNNSIPDAMMFWTSDAGVVNSTGYFTAQTVPGYGFVNVTSGGVTESASITVLVGLIDHIDVTPRPLTVVVGGSQAFSAAAFDAYNNSIPGIVFTWGTDVGTIDASGFFTAQTVTGTGTVTATNGTVTGISNLNVVVGDIDQIIVTPDPASIVVAETRQFTAIAYDIYMNVIPGIVFNWTTDMGSVDSTGLFTARTTPGIGTVEATNGSITGTAAVSVIVGPIDHIIVTPDPAVVQVGQTQQFTATGYDIYDNEIPGMIFTWGTDVGSVDATGLFTAQTIPGIGLLEATNASVTGNASVSVILGDIDHIVVLPDPVSIKIGETQQFTATAYDQFNNTIPDIPFFWTSCLGVINSTGFFTAYTVSGTGLVNATADGVTGSANVEVLADVLHHIVVTPSPTSVEVGTSQTFTAIGYDVYNNPIPDTVFLWSTNLGVVNFAGLFTAQSTVAVGYVNATSDGITGSASVTLIPGGIHHIVVTPDPASVTVGFNEPFSAAAYDIYNNYIPDVDFTWSTDVGTVDASGLFTAQVVPGTGTVTASNGTVSGNAVVNVILGPIDHIIVSPDPASIVVGGTQQFTATAYDSYNNIIPGVIFIWSTNVGFVDSGGHFTAQTTPGSGVVTAYNNTITGQSDVEIIVGPIDHIIVTPDSANVTVNQTQQFTAVAYDSFNNVVPGAVFVWSTTFGFVDFSGLYTAPTIPGPANVTATVGTVSGIAHVQVVPGPIDHITVAPSPVHVAVGQTQQFTAIAYDMYSNAISGVDFIWTATTGSVDANGLFTAPTSPGLSVLRAANGTISGTALAFIDVGPLDHIDVLPNPLTITVGETQQFTATALDVYDNVISGVDFTWSTDAGTIDATGLFTAQTVPGTGTVTAANGTVSGSASVQVVVGDVNHITVTPDPATVSAGESMGFTAIAYDVYNNPIPGTVFTWATDVGIVNSGGLLTAQTFPGSGIINATAGTVIGTATVNVVPGQINSIIVLPNPQTVVVGGTQQFTATAYDAYGNQIMVVDYFWTTNVGTVDAAGLLTARTWPGTGTVIATNGTVSGTANVNVIAGPLDHIIVLPDPWTMTADEGKQFTATGYDMYNNSVSISPAWEVDGGGSVDGSGYFISASVGTWTIYANDSGISGSAVITINHGLAVSIDIAPAFVIMTADDIQLYAAIAQDADGNYWDVTTGTIFTENDPVGTMILNAYHAGQTGNWTITGNYGGLIDTATVLVNPGAAAFITLDSPTFVNAGDYFSVTVTVYDADANIKTDYVGTISLSSSDPYPATLPPDHTFTLADAGTFTFNNLILYTRTSQSVTAIDTGNATLTDSDMIEIHGPFIQPEKIVNPKAEPNEVVTYRIYYNNTGEIAANNVWLNDTLPVEVAFISATNGGIESGGIVRWSFNNVLPGIHFVEITVQLGSGLADGTLLDNWVFCNYTISNGLQLPETRANATIRTFYLPDMDVSKTVERIFKDIVVDPNQWGECTLNNTITYMVNITNMQPDIDSVDMDYLTKLGWPVDFLKVDWTPLTDTNGNAYPDTGTLIPNGGNISIYVNITCPENATVGQEEYTFVQGTSFNNPNVIDIAQINTTAIDTIPVDFVLVIDTTGSMSNGNRMQDAIDAAKTMIDQFSDLDRCALFRLSHLYEGNNPPFLIRHFAYMTAANRASFKAEIDTWTANGGTPLWDVTGSAISYDLDPAAHGGTSRPGTAGTDYVQAIMVMTDGDDQYYSNTYESGSIDYCPGSIPGGHYSTSTWGLSGGNTWGQSYNYANQGGINRDVQRYRPSDATTQWMDLSQHCNPQGWGGVASTGGTPSALRQGLADAPVPVFFVALGVTPQATRPAEPGYMPDTDARYPFTSEYAIRTITNSSGGDYSYAPDSNELASIFQSIAQAIISLGGTASTGTRGTISAGDTLLYKVYYNNTGIGDAGDVWVNDTLPDSVTLTDTNASVAWVHVNDYYSWHFQNVTPGSHWFWIEVKISNTVINNQEILNIVGMEYTDSEGNYMGSDNSTANVTVSEPQIDLSKSVSLLTAEPGDFINYTVYYNNTGASMALFAWVNDSLDPHLQYVSDSAPVAPTINGNDYSWKIPGVIPGSYYFNITVQVLEGTPGGIIIDNRATSDFTNEGNVIHNETSISNTVSTSISNTHIDVDKIVDNGICDPGDTLVYLVYFNNTGSDNADNVWINDTLPGEVAYSSDTAQTSPTASPYFSSRTFAGQNINYVFTDVIPGNHVFQINVQVNAGIPDGTAIDNNVQIEYTDDLGFTLPMSTAVATSVCGVINITKSADMSLIPSAGTTTIRLTMNIRNCHSTLGLNNVLVSDTLPPGISWAGNVNTSMGSWNWDGVMLNWTIAAMQPLGTAYLSFDVSITPGGTGTFQLNDGASASGTTDTAYFETAVSNVVYVDAENAPILDYSLEPVSTISNSVESFHLNVTNIGTNGLFYNSGGDRIKMVLPFTWGLPSNIVLPPGWSSSWVGFTRTLTFTYTAGDYSWTSGSMVSFGFDLQVPAAQGDYDFYFTGSIHDASSGQYSTDRTIEVYAGIGAVDHIAVSPNPASMTVGDSLAFTATAYDVYNNVVPDVGLVWTTDIGSVDLSGILTAQTFPGSGTITANNGSVSGIANVTVTAGAFDHITIAPDPASVGAGQNQQFTATAHDVYGNVLTGYDFEWSSDIGSIDSTGLFTAPTTPVSGMVTATNGTVSYSATVTVVPWIIDHIEVTPDPVTLVVGTTQAFSATAFDVYGNIIPGVDFLWSSSVGTVDSFGFFTAQTMPAIGTVTASNGTVNGSASVNVIAGALDHILISPDPASVPVGQVELFTAVGYDIYNNSLLGIGFDWATNVGSVDSGGLFSAQIIPATGFISATNGTITGNAVVNVVSGSIDHIDIVPNTANVPAGGNQAFTATAYDVFNNAIPGVDFIWNTNVGIIDAVGMFTAQTIPASGWVTAVNGTISASATIDVVPAALDHIMVNPDPTTVKVGETQLFTAVAYDIYNNVIPAVDYVWSTDVGFVDSGGLFTAQTVPGTGTVTAANGTVSYSANVNIIVGDVDTIIVTPDPATVAVGDNFQFTAIAYDAYNNTIPGASFVWTTNVGIVNSTGYFTAQTMPASGTVDAKIGLVTGSSAVNIVLGPLHHIAVSPDPLTITVAGTQTFSALAYDEYNNQIPGVVFTWSTDVGTIDASGFFTAQTFTGTGIVTAANGTVSSSVLIDVIPGALDHITVNPNSATIAVGDSLQFTATGYDVYNNVIPGIEFTWTTDMGTIDAAGLFTAQLVPGNGTVTAANGTVSDSVPVDIVLGAVHHIIVTPDPVTVTVGDTQLFTATAYDQFNNTIPGVGFVWSTSVGSVAVGLFTAQTIPGAGIVTAANGTISSSATVTVVAGELDHIVVSPNPMTITVGDTQQFTAVAYDIFNNTIPAVDYIWTTDAGTIDASGLFTAQSVPGAGIVTAANGTISDFASVTVTIGGVDHIIVNPDPAFVVVDETQQFTAIAYDAFNNVVPGVDFIWTTDVGVIDSGGLFTAQLNPETGFVSARNNTVTCAATVNVIPGPVDHIIVTPDPATVTVGETQLFTAAAYDQYNNTITDADFVWTVDIGSVDASGLFTAPTVPGDGIMTATNGSINGTAAVHVVLGPVASIIITPDPVTVTVAQGLQLTGIAYDMYNNLIPDAVILWNTDVGVVNSTAYLTAQTNTATGWVNATSGGVTASVTVYVIAGTLHHIDIAPDPATITVGRSQLFNATGYDIYNNIISGMDFIWSTDIGSVDDFGFFTAQTVPGNGNIWAVNGTITGQASIEVVVGEIDHISIVPNFINIEVGGNLSFTAIAFDSYNNPIPGVTFDWITDVGLIDSDGFFTAQTIPASGTVTASNGTTNYSAVVNVMPGSLDYIVIIPDSVNISVGDSMQFSAVGYDVYDNEIPGMDFNWTTDIGNISSTGLFTARTVPGSGQVSAANGTNSASASVTVTLGAIDHIIVMPNPVTVVVGDTQPFTATAYDLYGNIIPGVDFIWTTDIGMIDATGLFTAQTIPSSGTVTASNSTINGSSIVTIIPGTIDHIIITPDPVNLTVGGTQQFTAIAYDSYDNVIPGVDFNWSANIGSIDTSGNFTAPTIPASGTVTARNGTVNGSASINVIIGPIDHIIMVPDPVSIVVNGTVQFTASAYDLYDNLISGTSFVWSTTVGLVNSTGFFTARTSPGTGWVNATSGGITGSASVEVLVGPIDHVSVTPDPVNMLVNGQVQFTATAYDVYNNSIPGITFDWTTDVGTVDGTGLLTAQSTPISGTITAVNGTFSDSADVNVLMAAVDHIIVVPDPCTVAAGGTQQFTAVAFDSLNNILLGVDFTWSTDIGLIDASGILTAQTIPGTGTVTAANGTINYSATVNVVPGAIDHIMVAPNPLTLSVGETRQFTATAYDVYNNEISGIIFDWSTDVGTVNSSGMFTAQTTPGTGTVTAANGTVSGVASITVEIGPADHVIIVPNPASIMVGGFQQFTATVHDAYGNIIPNAPVIWSTDVGLVNSTGFMTAQTVPAQGQMSAASGIVTGFANVTVMVGPLDHIIVSPDPVSIIVDGTQPFTGQGYDVYNNPISGTGFTWSTDVGSIDMSGHFTAQATPATGSVTATNGTVSGSASVDVIIVTIDHIVVSPDPATVTVGASQSFTAIAYDSLDNIIAGVDFIWSTNVGFVDSVGLFTAQTISATGTVTAANGTVSGSANVTVIPGPLDHIVVLPDPASVRVGETELFTATAYDGYGNVIPGAEFTWTTNVGSIDSSGLFTAQGVLGSGTVTAVNGTSNYSAVVNIIPGPVDHIIVTPDPATIVVAHTRSFTATAYDAFNNPLSGIVFDWSTDAGSVDSSGLFTAQTMSGTGIVMASNSTVNGWASVTIIPDTMDHIIVTPDPTTVTVGGTQQFTATAYDVYNNAITGVDFDWTTDIGSVGAAGMFIAQTTPANGIVTATNGTISDSASVEVLVGPIDHILVLPGLADLAVGASAHFFAIAYDAYNNQITGTVFTWSTDVGTINSTGDFIAQTMPGTGTVTATSGVVFDTADITVHVGALDHIVVSPDPVSVIAGGSLAFTATAYDVYNNSISGVDFIWTTDVGIIDSAGLFTAQGTPANGTVTAANGTVSGLSSVEVTTVTIDHIIVTPDPANVGVGDTQIFTAIAYDSLNNVIAGVEFDWSTDVGTIDSHGNFTAQLTPGTGTVTAANGTVSDIAMVNVVVLTIDHIIVTPDPVTVQAGATQQFTATAYDQFDNIITGVEFIWSTDIGTIDASGLFTAQTSIALGTVTAANDTVSDSSTVNVIPGPVASIVIIPNPASVIVGDTQAFTAIGFDSYGNVISGMDFDWSTDIGAIDSGGLFTAQTLAVPGTVTAANGTVSCSAAVNLLPGAIDHIILSPDSAVVMVGETLAFTAIAYDIYNNEISDVDFDWTSDVGSVDAAGLFTAQTWVSSGIVTATNGTVSDSAAVTLVPGALDHIIVSPGPVSIIVDGSMIFTAIGYDIYNNEIAGMEFDWSTDVGTINATGFFTAQSAPASGTVTATNGTVSDSVNVDVVITTIDHILVTPDPATVVVGMQQQFTAKAYDSLNNVIFGIGFDWASDVGTIDTNGLFTAQTMTATGTVTAINGTVNGSAVVNLLPGAVDSIIVSPNPAVVVVGGIQSFSAVAYDVYNNIIPSIVFDWSTYLGTVDSSGLFTAQTWVSSGIVTASNGTVSDSAAVTLVPEALDHIIVSPDPVSIIVDGSMTFTAIGYDVYNNEIPGMEFDWTTDVGSIDSSGLFTAQSAPTTGTVTATNGTVSDSAAVDVIIATVDHIIVTPDPVTVMVGAGQSFTATAYDSLNNVIFGIVFDWTTDIGSVDASGLFTAPTVPGSGTVTATNGSINGSATVDVIPGAVDHITVTPNPETLMVAGTQSFTATAYDSYNNVIPGVVFIWTTDIGSVDAAGLFTAQTTVAAGTVTATNGTVSDSAAVTLVPEALDHIIVSPGPVSIIVDGSMTFTAIGYDIYNNEIPGMEFDWTTNVGTINVAGFFTAQSAPASGTVTATNGTVSDSVNVDVIITTIDHILVTPDPATVVVGMQQQFTAKAYDSLNNVIFGIGFDWTSDVGTIDISGLFTAQLVLGSGTVTATNGSITGISNITITEESFQIVLNPGWNLISIPLILDNTSVASVLSSINGDWDRLYKYDELGSDKWLSYVVSRPANLNQFTDIVQTEGIWIHMLNPAILTVYGTLPTTENIPLYAGWNLIGYPSLNISRTFTEALAGTGYDFIEGFNASAPYLLSSINDMNIMMPGHGYWVHVPSDTVWTVINSMPIHGSQRINALPQPGQSGTAEPSDQDPKADAAQSSISKEAAADMNPQNYLALSNILSIGFCFIIAIFVVSVQPRYRRRFGLLLRWRSE